MVYDSAYKTLLKYYAQGLIRLVNHMYGLDFTSAATIEFDKSEGQMERQDGRPAEKRTDSRFTISEPGHRTEAFQFEFQSRHDPAIGLRMLEYAISTAHRTVLAGGSAKLELPRSGLIELRPLATRPDHLDVYVDDGDDSFTHRISVVYPVDFSLDELFDKGLLILLPFFALRYEDALKGGTVKKKVRDQLLTDCRHLLDRLRKVAASGELGSDESAIAVGGDAILLCACRVTAALARKHPDMQKEVESILRGQVFKFKTGELVLKARAEGIKEERAKARREIEAKDQEIEAKDQEIEAKDQEIKEIKRRMENAFAAGVIQATRSMGGDDARVCANLVSQLRVTEEEAQAMLRAYEADEGAEA